MPLNKRKFLPWPFNYAKNWYGVELSKTDIEYIDNVITADKMYRMILHGHNINNSYTISTNPDANNPKEISTTMGVWKDLIEENHNIHFFNKFLDDEKTPNGVKSFLYKWLGQQLGYIKVDGLYDVYLQRSFFTERWFEICR